MTVLKPLSFKFNVGDVDNSGRSLQVLDTVHRSTLMNIVRGKVPAGQAHFKNPSGIAAYNGFGADGVYYTAGVPGRTWTERQSIDDFSDRVTDTERWQGIVNDLSEGGFEGAGTTPFGYRLYAQYTGPTAEIYDRKGKMVRTMGSSNNAILSGRIAVPPANIGVQLENCLLLGIQQVGVDTDYVFVGVVKTITFSDVVVQGRCVGGIFTVTGTAAIPPGTLEVDVAINMDEVGSQYQGFYSFSPITHDYTGGAWNAIATPQALPGGWPSNAVPRVHAAFPAGATPGLRHHLSDVRVEVGGGIWEGQQKASWWLETQDVGRPLDEGGILAECPDELFVTFNRNNDGLTELVMVNVNDASNPLLWRRWLQFGIFSNPSQFEHLSDYWSPGWLDADEGHIVLTRHTKRWLSGAVDGDETGEVWLISLRWDKVLVFDINGVGVYLTFYDDVGGKVLREASNLGGRRWKVEPSYVSPTIGVQQYDTFQIPQSPNDFVGTLRNRASEDVVPAITYGVTIRRADNGEVYLAYGIQQVAISPAYIGKYYVGMIHLDEVQPIPQYDRWLFRKDDSVFNVWDESSEAWVVVGLSYAKGLWWLQGNEDGAYDEIEGVLCRRDWTSLLGTPNNLSTAFYSEDTYWGGTNVFEGRGMNLTLMDSDPAADEVVLVSTGWKGGAHLTVLWYNSITPANSIIKTYGVPYSPETPTHDLTHSVPSQEFPRWFSRFETQNDADLKRCRISGAAATGADSTFPVANGLWVLYSKFEGIMQELLVHDMIRGIPIHQGDFVLELSGKIVPPFAAGYGFDAINSMSPNQAATYELVVAGEKELMARIFVGIRGNFTGVGGIFVGAQLEYMTGSGPISYGNTISAPSIMTTPGSAYRLRIKRQGSTWFLMYYNTEQGQWEVLIEVAGLNIPVVPYIRTSMADFIGLPCGASMEIEHFMLAPLDDALGAPYYRNVAFSSVSAIMGSVIGGVVIREQVPTATAGYFMAAEGWTLPGLLPRP